MTSDRPLRGLLHGRATPYLYLLPALAIYAVFVVLAVMLGVHK